MSPCLCFPEQFEPIVNSHLVKLTSSQLLATSLILCSSIYSLVINFSKGGGACVDGLGDYANIKVYKLLPSFPSICSKKKVQQGGISCKIPHIFSNLLQSYHQKILYHTDQLNTYSPIIKANERYIRAKVSNWGKALHSV